MGLDSTTKKKILLCWPTDRDDLLQPFLSLLGDFHFVFLWTDYEKVTDRPGIEIIYYSKYTDPYKILREVKPEKILFFNIDSFPQVSLNIAARNRGITTYTMHHGIYSSNEIELALDKETDDAPEFRFNRLKSFYFYFSSLRLKNLFSLPKVIQFAYMRKKRNTMIALSKCVFSLRMPDYFIQLSEHNSIITKRLNGLSDNSKFLFIGHPFFDHFFNDLKNVTPQKGKYFLLIDFPNIESNLAFRRITAERKNEFYARLSSYAKSQGKRLRIKLHPAGYESKFNYVDENIDLIYDANILDLVQKACGCFAFYSTLIIPVVYFSKCCIIDYGIKMDIQEDLVKMGICKKIDLFSFDGMIDFDNMTIPEQVMKEFVRKYLFMADGNATERLKSILLE